MPLDIIAPNHIESRNLRQELRYVHVALRLNRDGDYNVYVSWPAVPYRAPAVMVEVHSAIHTYSDTPIVVAPKRNPGSMNLSMDQTESTLNESGDDQWQIIMKRALFSGEDDYVEI